MITFNKYIDEKGIEQIEKVDESGNKFYVPSDPSNSDYQAYLNPSAQSKEITTPTGGTN